MTKIYIDKLNEATLRVTSDDIGIEQELSEHFSFFVPGYKFMPMYRNKIWDGKARLYDFYRKKIAYGLYDYIKSFAKANEYEVVDVAEIQPKTETVSREALTEFIKNLKMHSRGEPIELRDYQFEAIYNAINRKKVLTIAPTSAGKSAIIYVVIRYLTQFDHKVALVVPTTSLVSQMFSDFEDYSSANKWDVDEHCHQFMGGKEKRFDKPVLISTWQSIHALAKNKTHDIEAFYKTWTVYIGDEAHKFASASLQKISERLVNAEYRIGTTGTVQDDKSTKLSLEGCFGPAYRVITTKQLMDNKQVVQLKIKCLMLSYPQEIRKLMNKADYQSELDYVVSHPYRNKFIAKLAATREGNTLVLFNFVDKHGKPLYEKIKALAKGRKVFYVSGEVSADEREAIRHEVDKYDDAIIVASLATFSTGINIPSIEHIIFAHPTKSKIRNLQSIGRGLRLRKGKTHCTLYDIADDMSHKGKPNHVLGHFNLRLETYSEEQFEFDLKSFEVTN